MAIIFGTSNDDFLSGTSGSDVIYGGAGNDGISGRAGNDLLFGEDGDDYLQGDDDDDVIDGGAGFDRAGFFRAPHGVTVSLLLQGAAQNTGFGLDTLIGIEHVSGSVYDDILIGDEGDNWLWGSLGGNDTLDGNGGNDLLMVNFGHHQVNGGSGTDTLSFHTLGFEVVSPATGGVTVSLALQGTSQDTGQGSVSLTSIENLSGSDFDDYFIGDDGANVLAGKGGNDRLEGGGGNDVLLGDGTIWTLTLGQTVSGQIHTYERGFGEGNDILLGGAGDDLLIGGAGADTLTGGDGNDIFAYRSLSDSSLDRSDLITDMDRKDDRIDLSAIDANAQVEGDQAFRIVKDGFTGNAGELFVQYDKATKLSKILMDVDGDAIADMCIYVDAKWAPPWDSAIFL